MVAVENDNCAFLSVPAAGSRRVSFQLDRNKTSFVYSSKVYDRSYGENASPLAPTLLVDATSMLVI